MDTKEWAVGVDLGGTHIRVARVNIDGEVQTVLKERTRAAEGPKGGERQAVDMIRRICGSDTVPPLGVGVGIAGDVDRSSDEIIFSPNLGWHNVPFRAYLQEHLDMPVLIINDVRAATWGEWTHGAGRGFDDLVCMFIGTGIGGGIVSGGRVLTGCGNSTGEIGHMVVQLDGPSCTCGGWGCLEALAGGWAIARRAQAEVIADPVNGRTLLKISPNVDSISARTVISAARLGDPFSLRIMEQATSALIAGAVSLVNAFGPCRLILGGGIVEGSPDLVGRIEKGVQLRAMEAARRRVKVVPSDLRSLAGVVGAATYFLKTIRT